jgi:hypothetical protein
VKPVLFRIFVLVSGALVLFAQTESFAARGGGGRSAGSSSRSSVSVGGYRAGEGQNRNRGFRNVADKTGDGNSRGELKELGAASSVRWRGGHQPSIPARESWRRRFG